MCESHVKNEIYVTGIVFSSKFSNYRSLLKWLEAFKFFDSDEKTYCYKRSQY